MYKIRVNRGWSISPDTTEVVVAEMLWRRVRAYPGPGNMLAGATADEAESRSSMIGQSEEAASLARETSPPGRSQRTRHKRAHGRCPRPPGARLRSHRRTRAQGGTPGFRPGTYWSRVEGGLGLWLFWPSRSRPDGSSASPSPEPRRRMPFRHRHSDQVRLRRLRTGSRRPRFRGYAARTRAVRPRSLSHRRSWCRRDLPRHADLADPCRSCDTT